MILCASTKTQVSPAFQNFFALRGRYSSFALLLQKLNTNSEREGEKKSEENVVALDIRKNEQQSK
jgi:hypothetical protein